MEALELPSPVKINLFLHVIGRRPDGYHELQTLFTILDHGDTLSLRANSRGELSRVDHHAYPLPENDLCIQAARLLCETVNRPELGAQISLTKRIPPGSGLGAGSSNAATTLLGLNKLWDLQLGRETLLSLGRELGADVPVFVAGESCWAEGAGDQLQPMPLQPRWYVVILPPVAVPTAAVFSDPELPRDTPKLSPGDYQFEASRNDLEAVTRRHYPAVDNTINVLDDLTRHGLSGSHPRMSGSGASVFVYCRSAREATTLLDSALAVLGRDQGFDGFAAQSVVRSPALTAIGQP